MRYFLFAAICIFLLWLSYEYLSLATWVIIAWLSAYVVGPLVMFLALVSQMFNNNQENDEIE